MNFSQVYINFGPALQVCGWVEGGEGWVKREVAKTPR